MATAELIACACKICDKTLCISTNEWLEVSNSYSTYGNSLAFSHPGLEQVEQKRAGSKHSELEGCFVKPLRCAGCKTGIGVKCVEAPFEKRQNT